MQKIKIQTISSVLVVAMMITVIVVLPACSTSPGGSNPVIGVGVTRLPFIARVINFPSHEPDKGRVIFILEVNYTDLQFVKSGDNFISGFDYTFTLANSENPENKQVIDSDEDISLASFQETVDKEKVLRVTKILEAPTGKYTANIRVSGKNANSRGMLSHQIDVNDMALQFSLTEPLLTWDSVHTFQSEKLIPFRTSDYKKDFFAFVVAGGLDTTQTLGLVYKLYDSRNESLYERSIVIQPRKKSVLFSLPIPFEKLSLGTTTLRIVARHKEENVVSSLNIRANFGYRPSGARNFTILIGPMRYIMPKDEHEALVSAPPDQQAELFNAFWEKRNPDPQSDKNSLLEEFYYRVEVANARFGWTGGDGYSTDRGRTMIKYGPPDAVQSTRRPGSQIGYEVWTYYIHARKFVFIDKYNDGNFQLLSDTGG